MNNFQNGIKKASVQLTEGDQICPPQQLIARDQDGPPEQLIARDQDGQLIVRDDEGPCTINSTGPERPSHNKQ